MSEGVRDFLARLERELPVRGERRRRILAEVEDHLLEAARLHGPEEALRRFGPPDTLVRGFAEARRRVAERLAALATLALLAAPVLAYPVLERSLPPAPWASAAEMPGQLAWKQDAVLVLFLVGLGTAMIGGILLARGRRSLAPVLVALAPLGAMSVLGLILAVQWQAEVPGTPAWLLGAPLAQLGLFAGGSLLAARAFRLGRAAG